MKIQLYNVWITRYGPQAKHAGIIGNSQHMKSTWKTGNLTWYPANDGTQENFYFYATDDNEAFNELTKLWLARHPHDIRPLSGKSYLRDCRVKVA